MADETGSETSLATINALVASAKEAFRKEGGNAIEVPASPGKESVKILPKAAFFTTSEQEYTYYTNPKDGTLPRPASGRTKKPYYAAYMFETKNDGIRFIVVPVILLLDDYQYNKGLLDEMTSQGFNSADIRANCQLPDVEDTFGYLDSRQLPALRRMMADRGLVTRGFNNKYGGYINSGWQGSFHQRLDIVGKEFIAMSARMNPYFTGTAHETYGGGIKHISQPLNPNTTNPLEQEIYRRVLEANK